MNHQSNGWQYIKKQLTEINNKTLTFPMVYLDVYSQFSQPYSSPYSLFFFNFALMNSPLYNCEPNQSYQKIENFKTEFSPIVLSKPSQEEITKEEDKSSFTKSVRKPIRIEKQETEDEEYTPGSQIGKKTRKNQQNENRNITPNIINQILSYIQKKNKSGSILLKLFEKYPSENGWTVKRFYLYQSMIKGKISHYVNQETMKVFLKIHDTEYSIYSQEEQEFYNKISRILIFYFLNSEAQTSTLTSKRMDSAKKSLHIQAQRQLAERLRQIYRLH